MLERFTAWLRSTFRNPQRWLVDALSGPRNAAGESVTEATAYGLPAYYACIRNIAEDVAKLSVRMYRRSGEDKTRITNHVVYKLLHDRPNPDMSARTWKETLTQHALGWGNGYSEIFYQGPRPYMLGPPIHPGLVEVQRRDSGELFYEVRDEMGSPRELAPWKLIHVHGFGFDGLQGYSVARIAAEAVGASLAAQKFSGAFYGNNAHMGLVLEFPHKLSDTAMARLQKDLKEIYAGGGNSWKPYVLENGGKVSPTGVPPQDALFIETRQFSIEELARLFRAPLHKVGHFLRAQGWSTLEQVNSEYYTDTLLPWCQRFEDEAWYKLLTPRERATLVIEHNMESWLRGDIKTRTEAYASAISTGYMLKSEARRLENWPAIDGIDDPPEPDPEPDPDPEPQEEDETPVGRMLVGLNNAHVEAFTHKIRQALGYELDKLQKAERDGHLSTYAARFYGQHKKALADLLRPAVELYVRSAWELVRHTSPPDAISGRVGRLLTDYAAKHDARSVADLGGKAPASVPATAAAEWKNGRAEVEAEHLLDELAADVFTWLGEYPNE